MFYGNTKTTILKEKTMNKTKKSLMIVSLVTLAISCLMLILAVFKVDVFHGIALRFLLIFATTSLACAIAISEINIIERKRILGFIGLGLLTLSVLMALVVFCSPLLFNYNVFNRITGIVAVLSVAFIAVLSIYSKLEKSLLGLQIPTYVALGVLAIMISILIGGFNLLEIKGMLEVLIIDAIVTVGLLIASSVIASKRKDGDKPETKQESELEMLKTENLRLKQENEELKAKLAELQK